MEMRPVLIGLFCLIKAAAFAADSPGPLRVVNGDFGDLSGMTQGQDTWYAGLPKGWFGSSGTYAVHAKRGATPPTCNPSNLGFLRQNVGVLDGASDVTLTFDVSRAMAARRVVERLDPRR